MVTFFILVLLFAVTINLYWFFQDERGEDFIKQARELKEYIQEHNEFSSKDDLEELSDELACSPAYSDWPSNIHHSSIDFDD